MAEYTLPDLPYDYGALEPHISGQIMELHHDKHHATYVKGANDTLAALAEAREKDTISSAIFGLTKTLSFHLGGHINHSIFWKNLSPDGGDKPDGELATQIDQDFGSFDKFKSQFSAAATSLQGSGWSILAYETISNKLIVQQITDQAGQVPITLIPLLQFDLWEHAFYLQYKNVKADYVKALWNVVNWADVSERYANAKKGIVKV